MSLEDDLLEQRLRRIHEIEALGFRAYGQRFEFTHTIPDIVAEYTPKTAEGLEPPVTVRIAGRIQTIRRMGKAGFAHLSQGGARLQIYVKKDAVSEADYALYQLLDLGEPVRVAVVEGDDLSDPRRRELLRGRLAPADAARRER